MAGKAEITAAAGRLRRKLEAVRTHQRGVWLREGVGLLLAAIIPALGLAMLLDNLVHLPMVIRILILGGLIAGVVVLIRRAGRMIARPITAEQIAVKVESKYPEIDNRLINSLLLAQEDDEESFELIREIVESGVSDASKHNLSASVPKKRMWLMTAAAALAILLMSGYAVMFPEYFGNALARLLIPFADTDALTRTRIVNVTPKDANVLSGDDVTIAVELDADRSLPKAARIAYSPDDEETQIALMNARDESNSAFTCLMADVSRTFTYSVTAGDATSDEYTITVHHRPVVEDLTITIPPPTYSGLAPMTQKSGTIKSLQGSNVAIKARCSKPIAEASISLTTAEKPIDMRIEGEATVTGSFTVSSDGSYRIDLTDTATFTNNPVDREIEVLLDGPPEIKLLSPPRTIVVKPEGIVPFKFLVTDQYGVQGADIIQVTKGADGKHVETSLQRWTAENKSKKTWEIEYQLPVSALKVKPGTSGVLQVTARDWNDVTGPGIARSGQIIVTVMSPQQAKDESQEALKRAALELAQIIRKQRANLGLCRKLRSGELREPGHIAAKADDFNRTIQIQEEIRNDSSELLAKMEDTLPMKSVLRMLYENEMVAAVRQLRAVPQARKPAGALHKAIDTERTILERLTGRGEQLRQALDLAGMRDIFTALEELQRKQKKIRAATDTAIKAGAAGPNKALADRQDALNEKIIEFKELLADHAHAVAQSDNETAKRFENAGKMIDQLQIRQNVILAATKLAKGDLSAALTVEDKILADLKSLENFLREPIVAGASKKLEKLKEVIADAKDKAEKLAKLEAAVKEISEEIDRSKDLTEDDAERRRQAAQEADELLEKMADVLEKMAKDLSVFPEIPVCNELAEKCREVFEDIEQAKGSEEGGVQEIAVDRDEGLLNAVDGTKEAAERMADMEMWLSDKPDSIKWMDENVDVDEIKDIPLADLPEELEDLVGDLVDKAEEMDQQAQDAASNAIWPDLPAGWDVMDGPMPSFGAKGKSGNERPNANEMTGRSGAGREGQSNGEIVGKVAKDLEGREPEARRTKDPFAKGQIEEENPNSEAKATGGGKQSGVGGEGGLRGAAPARNQMHLRDLERRQRKLRRDTESLYSKASLLDLPTGELDEAVLLMQKAEKQARAGNYAGFAETQRRIVHALKNTRRLVQGQGAVQMDPRLKLPRELKEEMFDPREQPIPPEFEKLVAEYYKAIAAGAIK